MKTRLPILIALLVLTGCFEKNTCSPTKAYQYWSGQAPPDCIELINARFWESAHWTKEYILFLELKPEKNWWDQLVMRNDLVVDRKHWTLPKDAPAWFKPSKGSRRYKPSRGYDFGSRYFYDRQTGRCFFYEIQL